MKTVRRVFRVLVEARRGGSVVVAVAAIAVSLLSRARWEVVSSDDRVSVDMSVSSSSSKESERAENGFSVVIGGTTRAVVAVDAVFTSVASGLVPAAALSPLVPWPYPPGEWRFGVGPVSSPPLFPFRSHLMRRRSV